MPRLQISGPLHPSARYHRRLDSCERRLCLSFEISGDLLRMVNLAQEVFFRNVVGIVDEVVTADRHRVGLEPTL